MKIVKIDCFEVDIALAHPNWKLALGSVVKSEGIFVKISTDEGIDGWGYTAPPLFQGEVRDGVRSVIEKHFAPYLLGQDPFDVEKIVVGLDRIILWNRWAKSAIDIALYDIAGKALGAPVYKLLGGLVRDEVEVMRIIPIKEPKEAAQRAVQLAQEGYKYLKIKISGEPDKDIQRIKEIRTAVGNGIILTVDFNQSYDVPTAIRTIHRLQEYDIALAEQPVRYDDWDGLASVTKAVDCFVEADESAKTVSDVLRLVSTQAATSFCLKIGKMGGIGKVKKTAAICEAANVLCRMGVAAGSQLVGAANMHIIASTPNLGFAPEAGHFLEYSNDPAEGLEVKNGKVRVPTGPGLGVKVNL